MRYHQPHSEWKWTNRPLLSPMFAYNILYQLRRGLHRWQIIIMTSSNGNIFRITALCEENPPVTGGFPPQRPVTGSFDVFFDLSVNKLLIKHSRRWWFETQLRSSWRHMGRILKLTKVSNSSDDGSLRINNKSSGKSTLPYADIDDLVQDCFISSALAMEILQCCTEPSILK